MHKVDQLSQRVPRPIVEGTDPLDAQQLAGLPTHANAIPPPLPGPDPEVVEKAVRRRFAADYKLQILREAEACTQPGQLGALLRCEGLSSAHLTTWRRQREQGMLAGLAPKARGRSGRPTNPLVQRLAELARENLALQRQLKRAEAMIEIQKKASELLAIPLESNAHGGHS